MRLRRAAIFTPARAEDVVAIWPPEVSVAKLLGELSAGPPRPRQDLVGQANLEGGSGGQSGRFFEVGGGFLKTSSSRCYLDADEALRRELPAERRRQELGIYHPERRWFLSRGGDGDFWACSLTPRLETLRQLFNNSAGAEARSWRLYLESFAMTFALAHREAVFLDCNPNNFGLMEEHLVYLDDDLLEGRPPTGFALQAFLRLREYPEAPPTMRQDFLLAFLRLVLTLPRESAVSWGLLQDLETELLWPPEAELRAEIERLIRHLRSTRRRGTP